MFNKRYDGLRVKSLDPIVALTPYIMPERSDSQVMTKQYLDFDVTTEFIRKQRIEGHTITHMGLLLTAYLRAVCEYPEMNRFVVNKRLFSRNNISVSFVTLKQKKDNTLEEALCKVYLDPYDTIYEVSDKIAQAIEEARVETNSNSTDKVAKFLMAMPLLPNLVVSLVKFMDAHGFMPKLIFEASPFHTSLFLSNMASLGMNYIYHHIYNFGTTSVFFTMGKTEQKLFPNPDGTVRHKRVMPMGIVIDERIAAGGTYARAFACMMHYINNPELLAEKPSEDKVRLEIPLVRTK